MTSTQLRLDGPNAVYASQHDEVAFVVDDVDGSIPRGLRGALLKNGPGPMKVGADPVALLDATGLVSSLVFDDGAARFLCRHVKTPLYEAEAAAKRMVRRRVFTNRPGRFKNVFDANVGDAVAHDVYPFAGRLFATGDGSHYALDPSSLRTLGRESFGLPKGVDLSPMTKRDAATDRLITYTTAGKKDRVRFVEIDERLKVVASAEARLRRAFSLVHDVAFTQRWYVVAENPASLSLTRLLSGRSTAWEAFEPRVGEPVLLHLVPRGGEGRAPIAIPLPADVRLVFHVANAYEDGAHVVVDVCAHDGWLDFRHTMPAELRARDGVPTPAPAPDVRLLRARIDPATGAVDVAYVGAARVEQPEVDERRHGAKYDVVWSAAPGTPGGEPDPRFLLWWHALQKVAIASGTIRAWDAGPNVYVSQPAFAPRPGGTAEDDGWLLAWTTDAAARTTGVVVLDARDPSTGPIATLRLGGLYPSASHVRWAPDVLPA